MGTNDKDTNGKDRKLVNVSLLYAQVSLLLCEVQLRKALKCVPNVQHDYFSLFNQ